MGIHHSPHTHTHTIPIPMGIPIPTAALLINEHFSGCVEKLNIKCDGGGAEKNSAEA